MPRTIRLLQSARKPIAIAAALLAALAGPALADTTQAARDISEPTTLPARARTAQRPRKADDLKAVLKKSTGLYHSMLGYLYLQGGNAGQAYAHLMDAARQSPDALLYQQATEIALRERLLPSTLRALERWKAAFPHDTKANAYHLQLDLRELLKRGNGLFGSAEQTGSIGVVTINCARLGHLHAGDEAALMARLDRLADMARDSLEIKRKVVQRLMDDGLFPYTKRYLGTLRNHFSTIGVNGINEMVRNFTGGAADISSDEGHALALRLLDRLRERMRGSLIIWVLYTFLPEASIIFATEYPSKLFRTCPKCNGLLVLGEEYSTIIAGECGCLGVFPKSFLGKISFRKRV